MNKKIRYHSITVPLGERTYPIYIGKGLLNRLGDFCKRHGAGKTLVIITDTTVERLYLRKTVTHLEDAGFTVRTIVIPTGEKQKNISRAQKIYTQLLRWNIDRTSTIVALGGGVVGDLSGFIAATYQRGVGFVQIPTTLLAQVDSSVGGKVGINHPLAKNMIGSFYQPLFVLIDPTVLKTLPQRELVCGLGEIVKYGIILDKKFFSFVAKNIAKAVRCDAGVLDVMIRQSCVLKSFVVSNDEREKGLRAILNFGHTVGHALEHAGQYSSLKHGEAVLIGMRAETYIAVQRSMISKNAADAIFNVIRSIPIPKTSSIPFATKSLITAMQKDKKSFHGAVRVVLPVAIGKVTLPVPVSLQELSDSIVYLRRYGS